jgi:ABC-2 type transport system permease protein
MFLVLTFGLPVIMFISAAIPIFVLNQESSLSTIGYVDQTGQLAAVAGVSSGERSLTFISFPSVTAARAALQQEEIGGYLVIPAGYFEDQPATFYADQPPGEGLKTGLATFMRKAMLANQPEWLLERLADPTDVTYAVQADNVEITEGLGLAFQVALPFVLVLMFAFIVLTGTNQMGSAIIREKEQRSMEMVITSVSPQQLVAGNVLGLALLSLTQLAIWSAGGALAVGLMLASLPEMQRIVFPWHVISWALLLGIPGYLLYAVLAAGLGVIAGDSRQAQQLAGLLGLLGMVPLWLAGLLLSAPNSPIIVALTLFPLTAPMISLMRMALGTVPLWQLIASFWLIIISLLASIWLVARIFRAAMLMYGQALRPGQLIQALREK